MTRGKADTHSQHNFYADPVTLSGVYVCLDQPGPVDIPMNEIVTHLERLQHICHDDRFPVAISGRVKTDEHGGAYTEKEDSLCLEDELDSCAEL